jgi:hypothetical protein
MQTIIKQVKLIKGVFRNLGTSLSAAFGRFMQGLVEVNKALSAMDAENGFAKTTKIAAAAAPVKTQAHLGAEPKKTGAAREGILIFSLLQNA